MTPVAYLRWAVVHVLEPSVEPGARLRSILSRRPDDAVTAAREALDAANASGSVDDLALARSPRPLHRGHHHRPPHPDLRRRDPHGLRDLAVVLHHIGRVHETRGDLDEARTHYTEAMSVYRQLRDGYGPPLTNDEEWATLSRAVERVRGRPQ